jgi:protein phosphatase
MGLDIYGKAIQGSRDYQEDYFEICVEAVDSPDGCLIVLCDGMGGHSGGALASHTAATAFISRFLELQQMSPGEALHESLRVAHEAIQLQISEQGAPTDMGTTLVAAYVHKSDVHWISVGDTHLYRYHNGGLEKLNKDHSMASVLDELAEIGRISKDMAESDPQRNALRSCLSADEISLIDFQHKEGLLVAEDKLILASDGLDTLDQGAIEKVIKKNKRKASEIIAFKLLESVEKAEKANQDNTTVVVVSVTEKSWFDRIF